MCLGSHGNTTTTTAMATVIGTRRFRRRPRIHSGNLSCADAGRARVVGPRLAVLPLLLPVLVFGTSAINQAVAGMEYQAQLYWMGFISMLSLTIGPLATTAGLRISLQVQ